MRTGVAAAIVALAVLAPGGAWALDKQGAGAHGGAVTGEDTGFGFSGALMTGVSVYNPTYAARPDNTGLALMRYAGHADVDLIGRRLSLPLDINMFTDRERHGLGIFVPSELDLIGGVTSTWDLGPGAFEIGARIEHDRPVDRGGISQTYADLRARYLYSIAALAPRLGPALADGDITGWLTLGWFAFNPTGEGTYFARPDNTGRALFRYAVHTELSVWHDHVSVGLDATFFTDSRSDNVIRPSELDLTPEIIGRIPPYELHLAYERDMPIDRGGIVQHFAYILGVFEFDLTGAPPPPVESRTQIPSP